MLMLMLSFRFVFTHNIEVYRQPQKCFPFARVVVYIKEATSYATAHFEDSRDHIPHTAQLWIHRTVRSDTLSSLFQYPVSWSPSVTEYHPVRDISVVYLSSNGALVGESPPRNELFTHNLLKRCAINTIQCIRRDTMEDTFRELGRFVPVVSQGYPVFVMNVNDEMNLTACLINVSHSFKDKRTSD
jgi:hypothetical protein